MIEKLKYDSSTGLIPAIIQDSKTKYILMHAFMNEESFRITKETKKVTFFSRSRQALWTKGETSGNFLELISWSTDCDQDTILIQVKPLGPTCHLGSKSCFNSESAKLEMNFTIAATESQTPKLKYDNNLDLSFLIELEKVIDDRFTNKSLKKSYVSSLIESGLDKIIQKVGEEAIETVISAKNSDQKEFIYESADLLFHLLVLLRAKSTSLNDIIIELKSRQKK